MRRAIWFLVLWLFLPTAHAGQYRKAGAGFANKFSTLLDRLDPRSDIVVLVDLAEVARKFFASLDDLEKIPLVAKNPSLMQIWKMQRAALDEMMTSLKKTAGVDLAKELGQAVMGVKLADLPKTTIVVSGKFPSDFPRHLDEAARKVSFVGRDIWETSSGMGMTVIDEKILVIADITEYPEVFALEHSARRLGKRHADLLTGVKPGFLLRLSFAIPAWFRATLPEREPGVAMFKGLAHIEIDIGDGMRFRARTEDDRTAENMRLFTEGLKELMLGGRNLMRAYIYFILGLELQYLPDIPLPLATVFENRKAMLETMEHFLGEYPVAPRVRVRGREVTLTAPHEAVVGNFVVIGTLAAIAIPAFFEYIHKSKVAEAKANLMFLKQSEEKFFQKYGKYQACGPVPRKHPTGDVFEWPGDPCFSSLGFDPHEAYFSYEVALVGKEGYLIRASADLDGDGVPMIMVLKKGDVKPSIVTSEEIR
jgi:hypothetical protein